VEGEGREGLRWDCVRRAGLIGWVSLVVLAGVMVAGAQATGPSFAATEGVRFAGQLGTMTTTQCVTAPITAGPSGTVSWGDGQSSPASYSYVAGTAPHQYRRSLGPSR
jgi:hypothetical protein